MKLGETEVKAYPSDGASLSETLVILGGFCGAELLRFAMCLFPLMIVASTAHFFIVHVF